MQLHELNDGVHLGDGEGAFVRRTQFDNGARVLTERMPSMRSATIAVWVPVGSRHEHEDEHGSTHFLEHLVFKGTSRRSALDISLAFDEVGGTSNAATSKEYTYYYAHVRDADLPMALDVLLDVVTNATLCDADVEAERGVILDELAMDEDDPEDVAVETFMGSIYGDTPLGRPVGGTPESVRALTPDALRANRDRHYHCGNIVVTAAGNVDHDHLVDLVAAGLKLSGWDDERRGKPGGIARDARSHPGAESAPGAVTHVSRPIEQVHLITGGVAIPRADPLDPAYTLFHCIFGGDSSSRLNQEIREKRGLTYSVYSFGLRFTDSGVVAVGVGCAPENLQRVNDLVEGEWQRLADHGITDAEFRRAVGGMSGYLALGLERTGARMRRLAEAELIEGQFRDAADEMGRLRATTVDDVQALAQRLFTRPRHTVTVGPVGLPGAH